MSRKKQPPDRLWYPTLLQSANNVNTYSWYDMKKIINTSSKNKKTKRKEDKIVPYLRTIKIQVYPNETQKVTLHKWYYGVRNAYNKANQYIKQNINDHNLLNKGVLRNLLKDEIKTICNNTGVNKHMIDYSISHCISMYKSAFSNLRNGHIKKFNIKNLQSDSNRYNLVIEKQDFSKKINGFCISKLGAINTQRPIIGGFGHNCILQYNKKGNKYFILVPIDIEIKIPKTQERYKKCGIDLGVRTFATVYSPEQTLEIGNNTNKLIDKYNLKKENFTSQKDKHILKYKLYKKLLDRYGDKLRNKIKDMHCKVSSYLTNTYKEINLGKMSIQNLISNEISNISELIKKRILGLSFYKFKCILELMGKKYDCKIIDINEFNTTKTCHNCKTKNENVGLSKTFTCINNTCNISLGRDINASINIYNGGF